MALSDAQVEQYRREGYLILDGFFSPTRVDEMRAVFDQITSRAASMSSDDDVIELEDGHAPDQPRVRRLKRLFRTSPPESYEQEFAFFRTVATDPDLIDVLQSLLGDDIRIQGGKLNAKSAQVGTAVEWHQDWAFYPHTNDDLLAVGIMMDNVTSENGPLLVLPGSHLGPTYDHHHEGFFVGAIDVVSAGLDLSNAREVTGTAGTISLHHVRLVHGSAQNTSQFPRRLILPQYAAVDAWPLKGCGDFDVFNAQVIAGGPSIEPRVVPTPIRMPFPVQPDRTESLFQHQKGVRQRYFA